MTWTAPVDPHHAAAVAAAHEGLCDPALGALRVPSADAGALAEAAVSSATPFVRGPLLSRMAEALLLHSGGADGVCRECARPSPCPTTVLLRG